jgi:hypothetical protein
MYLKENKLCFQNMIAVLDLIINVIGWVVTKGEGGEGGLI